MTIDLRTPLPMPSRPHRRDGKAPLPAPDERRRLRLTWQLTEEQVAQTFGVRTATVRSWEAGRTSPTGARRAAYAAFLGGLAHGLVPVPTGAHAGRPGARPPRSPRRPAATPDIRPSVTPRSDRKLPTGTALLAGHAPTTAGRPVGPGPDPVAPARLRRFRRLVVAVGVWIVAGHVMATMPPGHL
ncbi:hypothetical protein V2W30_00510 [Streptomyces sp. Q6]|uniref:Uncharacterized protein n=1 Tax=Streptomyces citrinus TaxID=3118173 RepID=A0ACD5A564_9ACTN